MKLDEEFVPILFPRWDNGEPVEVRFPKEKDMPVVIGVDFAQNQWKFRMIEFLQEKQLCAFDNNKMIIQGWINELKEEL